MVSGADLRIVLIGRVEEKQRRRSPDRDRPNMWIQDSTHYLNVVLLGKTRHENSGVGNIVLGQKAFDREAPHDVVERVKKRSFLDSSLQVPVQLQNVENMVQKNKGSFYSTLVYSQAQAKLRAEIEKLEQAKMKTQSTKGLHKEYFTSFPYPFSVTRECQKETCEFNGRRINCIDTPGLFDTGVDNAETSKEILKCILMAARDPYSEMFQQVEKNIKEEKKRILKEKIEGIKRKQEELKTKYEALIEEMKKENKREKIQNELRKREEDFKKREEEIKKETDEILKKELQRELEEQQKQFEDEKKIKEKALGEQQQSFIKYLEEKHDKEKHKLQKKIQRETREAECEYREKLNTEVARALQEAEESLPYRPKRARDWGYYVPVVGGAAGALVGGGEDWIFSQ